MPVVKIKRIVSVSSEDSVHSVDNLLSPTVGLQWLCRNDNKSKKTEVVLELAKLSRIKQIEIGNSGSAFVEVLVQDSMVEGMYVSLLPQSMLMSAEESKSGRNLSRTKHFSTDRLSKVATEKKWLCVKVVCLQPFSVSRQFGLRHIVLLSHTPDESTPTKTLLISPLNVGLLVSPKPVTTPHRGTTCSVTPLGQRPSTASKSTPSRRRKRISQDDGLDFEFSGLESQSRLLNNTLKNDPSTIKGNPILSRIASERQSMVKNREELGNDSPSEKGFIRKKLLTKELPKVESVDFLESYSVKDPKSQNTNRYSMFKLSNLDNSAEIGADDKETRDRKRRNKTASTGQWINARKKKTNTVKSPTPLNIPTDFELFPTTSTEQKSLDSYFQRDVNNEVICIDDDEPNDITNVPVTSEPLLIADDVPGNQPGDDCAQCPVCGEWFPLYAVEVHASQCAERTYGSSASNAIHI